jgi:hypothetical protein
MLAFRKGRWITVEPFMLDPLFTETIEKRLAAAAATEIAKGSTVDAARGAAEAAIYQDLLGVSREQHNTPKH